MGSLKTRGKEGGEGEGGERENEKKNCIKIASFESILALANIEGIVDRSLALVFHSRRSSSPPLPSIEVGKRGRDGRNSSVANFCPWMYELVASTTAKVSTTTIAHVWYGFYWESKAFR